MTAAAPALSSWRAVLAELERRIAEGDWRPGELIPKEVDLAGEFGCSRATVNRALTALVGAGLVERRRRAGSRVALAPVRRGVFDVPIIRREVEALGAAHAHLVLSAKDEKPPAPIAGRFGAPAPKRLFHIRTLHLADGRPWVFEDRWLSRAEAPDIAALDLEALSVNEWLVRTVPMTACDLVFRAENATAEEAEILDLPIGAALFITERTTWRSDAPITYVRLAAGPGYSLKSRL